MIYLASPYSDLDHHVRQRRYEEACRYTAFQTRRGKLIFSPIVYGHVLHVDYDCGGDWATWADWDSAMLRSGLIKRFHILMLDGWRESKGIKIETEIAEKEHIEILYVESIPWSGLGEATN